MARISGSSEEATTTAVPSRGEAADDLVDLGLGADVDAVRRLVEEQHLGPGEERAGEERLLLVAARERGDRLADVGHADAERAREPVRRPSLRLAVDEAGAAEPRRGR